MQSDPRQREQLLPKLLEASQQEAAVGENYWGLRYDTDQILIEVCATFEDINKCLKWLIDNKIDEDVRVRVAKRAGYFGFTKGGWRRK